jgi:NADH-quinone oxidoreductase subunit E
MNGAESVLAHVERKLGIKPGQTTPDGRYTLSTVECLGSCGTAPMMMVNDGYHENLTFTKLDELLEGLI